MNLSRLARPRTRSLAGCAAAGAAVFVLFAAASPAHAAGSSSTFETQSPSEAAESLMGANISLVSAELSSGRTVQASTFSGLTLDPAVAAGVALSTGSLRAANPTSPDDVDFTASALIGPHTKLTTTGDLGGAGSSALTNQFGATTYDAAQLDMTVIPEGDTLTIVYQFGSEEYAKWAPQGFADAVGIFVDGTLCSLVGGAPVSTSSISAESTPDQFVANFDETGPLTTYDTEMNAFSTALTCTAPVTAGAETAITAAVADTEDGQLDTTLLLSAAGISSSPAVTTPGDGAGAGGGSGPENGGGDTGAGTSGGTDVVSGSTAGTSASPIGTRARGDLARTGLELDPLGLVLAATAVAAVGTVAVVTGVRRRAAQADAR